ncbi:MAG: hypothetical protein BSOLF_1146 [Candidatus Carbobacillus altaicus]|uniref:Uncharacterized protein n=1 Tax=Candidatus Carbonibacillus altaicus TaxID=2163959 RepID=A0A2R6Y4M4_9BACL|nr:MAG: hypothetical protein BSOLF_1146 [Candidatus Carbobacillus altaicus]
MEEGQPMQQGMGRYRSVWPIRIISLVVVLMMLLLPVLDGEGKMRPASAKDAGPLSDPLTLDRGVTAELLAVYHLPQGLGQEVTTFLLQVKNESNQTFDFFPYWIRLDISGKRIPIQMVQPDDTLVLPDSEKTFIFYATMSERSLKKAFQENAVQVKLIRWDTSANNFERLIHTFTIHEAAYTAQGKKQPLTLPGSGGELQAELTHVTSIRTEETRTETYRLKLENTGKAPHPPLPYALALLTEEGVLYPFEAKDGLPDVLLPFLPVKLEWTVTVPKAVQVEKASVYVLLKHGGGEDGRGAGGGTARALDLPLAMFQDIPHGGADLPSSDEPRSLADDYTWQSPPSYKGRLAMIGTPMRLPFGKEDRLTIAFNMINEGEKSFALPNLEGTLTLEDEVSGRAVAYPVQVTLDERDLLYPGQHAYGLINVRLPYDVRFTKATLTLKDIASKTGGAAPSSQVGAKGESTETETSPVMRIGTLRYKLFPETLAWLKLGTGKQYIRLFDTTYVLELKERWVEPLFQADRLTSVFTLTNETNRPFSTAPLHAFYLYPDGRLYPAEVTMPAELAAGDTREGRITAIVPDGEGEGIQVLLAFEPFAAQGDGQMKSGSSGGGAGASSVLAVGGLTVPSAWLGGSVKVSAGAPYIWEGRRGAAARFELLDTYRLADGPDDLYLIEWAVTNTGQFPFDPPVWEARFVDRDGALRQVAVDVEASAATFTSRSESAGHTFEGALDPGFSVRYLAEVRLPKGRSVKDGRLLIRPTLNRDQDERAALMQVPFPTFVFTEGETRFDQAVTQGSWTTFTLGNEAVQAKVEEVRPYCGEDRDIVSTVVRLKHQGLRPLTLPQWIAYYEDQNGRIYPAQASATSELLPDGEALLEFWAPLPDVTIQKTLNLILAAPIGDMKKPLTRLEVAVPQDDCEARDISIGTGTQTRTQLYVEIPPASVMASVYSVGDDVYNRIDYTITYEKGVVSDLDRHTLEVEWCLQSGNGDPTDLGCDIKTISFNRQNRSGTLTFNIPDADGVNGSVLRLYDVFEGAKRPLNPSFIR